MTETAIQYLILLIIGIIAAISFVIGLDKMVKIVFGNYLLGALCLSLNLVIEQLITYLQVTPDLEFLFMSGESLAAFFVGAKTLILLMVYVGALFLWYKKSTISIQVPADLATNKLMMVFFVPITVISFVFTLGIILLGDGLTNPALLETFFGSDSKILSIVYNMPLWIFLYTIIIIVTAMKLKTYRPSYEDSMEE